MRDFIFLFILIFTFGCNQNRFVVSSNQLSKTGGSAINNLQFAGIETIDDVTGVSARLNWSVASGGTVATYSVFEVVGGVPRFIASTDSNTYSYVVNNLSPGTQYSFQVKAVNSTGAVDSNTKVESVTTLGIVPPTLITYTPAVYSATVGSVFTSSAAAVTAGTPSEPVTFSILPALPAGLSLNATTGIISGTSTVIYPPTTFTVTGTNAGGPTSTTLQLRADFSGASSVSNITGAGMRVNWSSISDAIFYSVFNTTSGTPVFVGVAFSPATSYDVSGLSPSTAYRFKVNATNSLGVTDLNTVEATGTTLAITPPSSLSYTKNSVTYLRNVPIADNVPSASGDPVVSYAIAPALPAGLTFNTNTGVISGTPTVNTANANYTVTATNAGGSTTKTINLGVSEFGGISNVDKINGVSARLNWTAHIGSDGYRIYSVSGGTATFITYLPSGGATNYTLSGLEPDTNYTYRVRAVSSGFMDTNLSDATFKTLQVGIEFKGWRNVKALGPKVPAHQAPDISSEPASVTLDWEPMKSTVPIVSYNIYRRDAVTSDCLDGGGFGAPIGNVTLRTFQDTSVIKEKTYCYKVVPIVTVAGADNEVTPAFYTNVGKDTEIKVIVPPDNMVLLHRWMANKDMCQLMQRPEGSVNGIDRSENYRCGYTGLGSAVIGYYDVAHSKLFDRYEMGVNWTPGDGGSGATSCGDPVHGCWGLSSAAVTGIEGNVYWGRWGYGQVRFGGDWKWIGQDSSVPDPVAANSMSEKPGLPPVHNIGSGSNDWHQRMCQLKTAGSFGSKRMLTKQEMFLLSAWHPDQYENPLLVKTLELGTMITGNFGCLVDGGPGLDYENGVTYPANPEMVKSGGAPVRTGSNVTKKCVSRYGAQDLIGNMPEFVSDMMSCSAGICSGITSTIDPTNSDWVGYVADGLTMGPLAAGSIFIPGVSKYSLPLGLPALSTNTSLDAVKMGTGAGEFNIANYFFGMQYYIFDFNSSANLFTYKSGSSYVGRYGFNFTSSIPGNMFGFRCAVNVD